MVGSGRSGTSLVAGLFANAGYYMGDDPTPLKRRDTNPKGLFEDERVESINETLLAPLFPEWPRFRRFQARWQLSRGLRWAAALPEHKRVGGPGSMAGEIEQLVARSPFCFKDPRFCYTLPAWQPHVDGAALICVFREPARTAQSIVTEWGRHDRSYKMTHRRALRVWRAMYGRVISYPGEWLFVHFDQVLAGEGIDRIEQFVGAKLDRSHPDESLKRSSAEGRVGGAEARIYRELCERAGYPAP